MVSGIAAVNIYGSYDGTAWQLVWQREAPDAVWGAGHECETPPTFTYTIQSNYPFYRLELHGKMNEPDDGWIAGPLSLTVD
jgi:hypothetical protein